MRLIKIKGCGNSENITLILAHGAGAPADSPFMEALANALKAEGITTVRFEFPYMQKRRADGKKRPPDRQVVLLEHFSLLVDEMRAELGDGGRLLVGGKSMGGRMASLLASQRDGIDGVACYGYPFHPPGKPEQWRTGHFHEVRSPALIVQGTRDPFGKPDEMVGHEQALGFVRLRWLEGGNHDFQPLKRQQLTWRDLLATAARETRIFIDEFVTS
ncbi:alpha/beta family hydrolase [Marinobacter subterrani]|uniref:Putative hydrolase of the alpha/beta-hydrolase fold n=1 Tax=Marinobacter subterrani TaxID=1658765 RepID=A0A0J7M0Y8_9GAMM|nr:alpha/beta family hydrolase [Marinobacter subterrani]KMQ74750.1 putative hydrolase of the alpha/beta-hydrolase fold [Marinobacter subterrani]